MRSKKYERMSKHFQRIYAKDKILKWLFATRQFGLYNYRIDELRRYAGIDVYLNGFVYRSPDFFKDEKLKAMHIADHKARLRVKLKVSIPEK